MSPTIQVEGARTFLRLQHGLRRETLNGPGSTIDATTEVREWLPRVIREHGIRSLADIPCGDHHWMSKVALPCEYVGYDVLEELVTANRISYPHRRFETFNAVTDVPPQADLILCRDLLVHLTLADAQRALRNFKASGARFIALTTFPGAANAELAESHPGWGWRPLDMEAAPFAVGEPVDGIREVVAGERWERWLRVYRS